MFYAVIGPFLLENSDRERCKQRIRMQLLLCKGRLQEQNENNRPQHVFFVRVDEQTELAIVCDFTY
jgi:hypothetical protein